MIEDLKLDLDYEGPIYQQIADCIARRIEEGSMSPGSKLPAVRALAAELGVACGTVKHAYELLKERGCVNMVQGSGSFVLNREEDGTSRKEKAMAAIDQMFLQLEKLGFTPREMEIYLNLKLRGLNEKYDIVKAAVIDCNPETLHLMEQQLSQIGYVETALFDLDGMEEAPALKSDYDLIITTSTHFSQVEQYIGGSRPLAMVAMTPSVATVIGLAKIPDWKKVGIFCVSDAFAAVVRNNCRGMGNWSEEMTTQLMGLGTAKKTELFFDAHELIIVPEFYDSFLNTEERAMLRGFKDRGGELLTYRYQIDRGSFLYVTEQIKRVMNKKRTMQ